MVGHYNIGKDSESFLPAVETESIEEQLGKVGPYLEEWDSAAHIARDEMHRILRRLVAARHQFIGPSGRSRWVEQQGLRFLLLNSKH